MLAFSSPQLSQDPSLGADVCAASVDGTAQPVKSPGTRVRRSPNNLGVNVKSQLGREGTELGQQRTGPHLALCGNSQMGSKGM